MIHIKKFENHSEYEAFTASTEFVLPNASYCANENEAHYTPKREDHSHEYFTIEAIDDNCKIDLDCPTHGGVSISTDGGSTWSEKAGSTSITIDSGEKVLCKGDMEFNTQGGSITSYLLDSSGKVNISGNIFSLFLEDDFANVTDISEHSNAFCEFFKENTNIVSARDLSLPPTTLADGCYKSMFDSCTSLTEAPSVLPATTLADSCYEGMFSNCTSLTTVPQLLATTLVSWCYRSMFEDCTSLTEAPELQATTLAEGCYNAMFRGCTSLTTAPQLPATTLANQCYEDMFHNCTSLTEAPQLLATTLVGNCYASMFQGCSRLNYIKCLATDISATYCTGAWVYGVASSGTFVKAPSMTSWTSGSSGIPTNWIVQ